MLTHPMHQPILWIVQIMWIAIIYPCKWSLRYVNGLIRPYVLCFCSTNVAEKSSYKIQPIHNITCSVTLGKSLPTYRVTNSAWTHSRSKLTVHRALCSSPVFQPAAWRNHPQAMAPWETWSYHENKRKGDHSTRAAGNNTVLWRYKNI